MDIGKSKITKPRPVHQPIYVAGAEVPFTHIEEYPVANLATYEEENTGSILDIMPKNKARYTDISGRIVTMRAKLGEKEFSDVVRVVAELDHVYVVTMGGVNYSVRKSMVRFTEETTN